MSEEEYYEDDFVSEEDLIRSVKTKIAGLEAENAQLKARVQELEEKLSTSDNTLRLERVRSRRQASQAPGVEEKKEVVAAAAPQNSNIPEIDYSTIVVGDQLAGGTFGLLYKGTWSGCVVAVKRLFDPNINDQVRAEFQGEISMLSRLRHPNIVQFLGACTRPPYLCIITEFMARGSLYHVLHQSPVEMNYDRQLSIARQIAAGLAYCHACDIVHNDIKAYNVLVDEYYRVKLCDFGLARTTQHLALGREQIAGTPPYMAPELWQKRSPTTASDVYAFGVLMCELFSREVPFDGLEPLDIRERVIAGRRPTISESCPRPWTQLIKKCMSALPADRPTFEQILKEINSMRI